MHSGPINNLGPFGTIMWLIAFALFSWNFMNLSLHAVNLSFWGSAEGMVDRNRIIIIIIIGIYIAPFPFIKCSKALHIVIV